MEKIGIISDEAADLPPEIIEKHQIIVVPVKLDWPEIENLPGENTFQKMRELEKRGIKSFGKTSQPSPKDFLDRYKQQLEVFDKVICITITSKHSGTYNSAIQARNFLKPEEQGKIFIIDSLSASAGQALLVLKAVDLAKEGKDIKEVVRNLEEFIPQIHSFLIFDDPKWIEASGRISHLAASLLERMKKAGIRPVLTFKKGTLTPVGIQTKAQDIAAALFRQSEKIIKKLTEQGKKIRMVITHGDDLKGAQRLKEMVEKQFENTEVVFLNIINNVVGAPAGPDTLVISFCQI